MNKRDSRFEILRIISMFLIIMHHFVVHGIDISYISKHHALVLQLLSLGGKIGVNIFILIFSYFIIYKEFSLNKVFKTLGQVWFYSFIIFLFFKITNIHSFTLIDLLKIFFPIIFNSYWFVTMYIFIFICSYFFNDFVKTLDIKKYKTLLICSSFILIILPLFKIETFYNNITWFFFLYLLGGYLRRIENNLKISTLKSFIIAFGILFVGILIIIITYKKSTFYISKYIFDNIFYCNGLIAVLFVLFLFLGIIKLKSKECKLINIVSKSTLAIYLIHDNFLVREYLWNDLFSAQKFACTKFYIQYCLLTVLIVFIVSFLIDVLIRQLIFEKFYNKLIDYIFK